jgi:hypothetical protein
MTNVNLVLHNLKLNICIFSVLPGVFMAPIVVLYGYIPGLFWGYSRVFLGLFWVFKYLKAQNNPKILLVSA